MTSTIMKFHFTQESPKTKNYRDYRKFDIDYSSSELSLQLKKCPNTTLVRVFLYSDCISRIYGVNLRILSEYRKIRTRKTSYLDTFHAVLAN